MKEEVYAAVNFLTRLVRTNENLSADQVEVFQRSLGSILMDKFKGHWFPEKPCKGQAYRCIRVNGRERRDPVLEQAAEMCGLQYENLKLPVELTVWVDPLEVCCRFGEDDGSYCTVASFKDNKENLNDNLNIEDLDLQSSITNQNLPDCPKKQKSRRKTAERQKKHAGSRNFIMPQSSLKGFYPKAPQQISSKNGLSHQSYYFDWNPATIPLPSSRVSRANGFCPQDSSSARRPRKPTRSTYPND
ncbi:hypothetical protein X975_24048, partial [Stegodyphus mimosarum]